LPVLLSRKQRKTSPTEIIPMPSDDKNRRGTCEGPRSEGPRSGGRRRPPAEPCGTSPR
jgi:hypothetical protein